MTSPVMVYHGAKFRLAPWVISFFPKHHTYVEPFGGAAGVLIQKPRSKSEVYNDLDSEVVNVFRVLQDPDSALELQRLITLTPYSRDEFLLSYEPSECTIEQARRTIIRASQGFGSAGASNHKTGFKFDSAREGSTAAHVWAKYPSKIVSFLKRLQNVIIENKPAIDVIENHDRTDTLFYLDPPYVFSTRKMRKGGYYRHEMTDEDHAQLLTKISHVKGMVVLSGYDNELYNDSLRGWEKHSTLALISASRGAGTRTETLWLSPNCQPQKYQTSMF